MFFQLAPYLFAAGGGALITAAVAAVWWARREDRRVRERLALAGGLRVSGRTDGQGSSDHAISRRGDAATEHVVSLELERARRRRARRDGFGGAA